MNYYALLTLCFVFFFSSTIFVYAIVKSPFIQYFLDEPDSRKMHQLQIPRIGGFAIILSYGFVLAILAVLSPQLLKHVLLNDTGMAIGFATILIFILGFFDDSKFVTLNVPTKFGVQFTIAIGVVYFW